LKLIFDGTKKRLLKGIQEGGKLKTSNAVERKP